MAPQDLTKALHPGPCAAVVSRSGLVKDGDQGWSLHNRTVLDIPRSQVVKQRRWGAVCPGGVFVVVGVVAEAAMKYAYEAVSEGA